MQAFKKTAEIYSCLSELAFILVPGGKAFPVKHEHFWTEEGEEEGTARNVKLQIAAKGPGWAGALRQENDHPTGQWRP